MTRTSKAIRGSTKIVAILMILVGGSSILLYVAYRAANAKAQKVEKVEKAAEKTKKSGAMSDQERLEYIEKFVKIEGLQLAPDTKPDSDEVVPGLLRVTGVVTNGGERKVERLNLSIYPKDQEGKVLGSIMQNVAGPHGLEPGGARQFKFQIPEKKEFGGTFDHKLQ